ncbi:MAG: choice-of-anchor E domain-containing protein [Acidobacteria bacterium]|nr:choice-of-anchor E domain-containing protein [Acidobacteriota bacterium]
MKLIIVCAVYLMTALPSTAATITHFVDTPSLSYLFPSRTTSAGSTVTDVRTVNLLLPKFDASLGILDSAKVWFTGQALGSVTGALRTRRSSPTGVNANLEILYTLTPGGSGTPVQATIPYSFMNETETVAAGNRGYSFTLPRSGARQSITSPIGSMPSNYLSTFVGVGSVVAPLTMRFRQDTFTSAGTVDFNFAANTVTRAFIEYQYTSVPEPSTLAMVVVSVLLIAKGGARHR